MKYSLYRCCVGGCNNDSRYKDKVIKRSNVNGGLRCHYFPTDPVKREQWRKNVSEGLFGFFASDQRTVYSNHFEYGKPGYGSPNPTLYLVPSDVKKPSPRKRRMQTVMSNEREFTHHVCSTLTRALILYQS